MLLPVVLVPLLLPAVAVVEDTTTTTIISTNKLKEVVVEAVEATAGMGDMEVMVWLEEGGPLLHGRACTTMFLSQTPTKAQVALIVLAAPVRTLTRNTHRPPMRLRDPKTPVNLELIIVVEDGVETAAFTLTHDKDSSSDFARSKKGLEDCGTPSEFRRSDGKEMMVSTMYNNAERWFIPHIFCFSFFPRYFGVIGRLSNAFVHQRCSQVWLIQGAQIGGVVDLARALQ